jgi:hypothetical protein
MTLTAALVVCATAVQFAAAPALAPLAESRVVRYEPGVMRQVANNRGMVMLDWVDGYASTRRCERVDTRADPTLKTRPWLVLASINGGPLEVYQAVDCSHPKDLPMHKARGLILEVDHASGKRNKVDALNGRVTIWRIWRP